MSKSVSELSFSEMSRYKSLLHFYGEGSVEVTGYLESLGSVQHMKPPKRKRGGRKIYATRAEANRMSSRFYYERNADLVKLKQRIRYAKKRFAKIFMERPQLQLIGFEHAEES